MDCRGEPSHVSALGLAVHEDVQADALLLIVGVLDVLVDDLLVVGLAQLALLVLQPRPTKLCNSKQAAIRSIFISPCGCAALSGCKLAIGGLASLEQPGLQLSQSDSCISKPVVAVLRMHSREPPRAALAIKHPAAEDKETCWRRCAPAVWGKEPMVVVGNSTVWIWEPRRALKSWLRPNRFSAICSLGSSAHKSTHIKP